MLGGQREPENDSRFRRAGLAARRGATGHAMVSEALLITNLFVIKRSGASIQPSMSRLHRCVPGPCKAGVTRRLARAVGTSLAAALLVVLLPATPASAQATGTGVLTGTVTDASDKRPLADTVVTASSPDLQGEQVVVSDAEGFFRIPDLPSGTYTLRFEKDGSRSLTRDGIGLRADTTLRVNAALLPEVIKAEEVVVEARAPVVDVGSSSIGQNITSDFVKRIPVASPDGKGGANRLFEAASEVVPGAKSDYNGSGISFAGASSPENNYVIDGLSVNNPGFGFVGTALSTEFVKETNVISGGYMPEYGRTMGGVLNVVTKSGSNEFHGGFFSYVAPGALQAPARSVSVLGPAGYSAIVSNQQLNYVGDIGADVGGPIVKDKLWFYAGFDISRTSYNVSRYFQKELLTGDGTNIQLGPDGQTPLIQKIGGSDQSWEAESQTLQAIAKLTWAVNPDNKLTGTFIAAPTWTGGAGKFAIDPISGSPDSSNIANANYGAVAHILNSGAYDASLKWSSAFDNKRLLLDTTAGVHYEESEVIPSDGSLPGASTGLASVPQVTWYNGGYPLPQLEPNNPLLTAQCALPANLTMAQRTALANNGVTSLCPAPSGYITGGPSSVPAESNGRLSVDSSYRFAVGSTLTALLHAAGHHVLKAGFNVELTQFDHLKAHPGGFDMSDGNNPLTGAPSVNDAQGFGTLIGPDNPVINEPWRVIVRSLMAGGFVQDSWSVMNFVTLNLGVRYDAQQMFAGDGTVGLSLPNQWSPRLGVIWDPTQRGSAKIFVNYARYYQNVPLAIAQSNLTGQSEIFSVHPALDANGGLPGTCDVRVAPYCNNAAGRSIQTGPPGPASSNGSNPVSTTPSQIWQHYASGQDPVDPDTQATSVDDFVAGGEYEIFENARLGATYQRRWINRWIEDMSLDGRNTFFVGNPGYGWAAKEFPKAERTYDAFTLYLMKTFSDDWLASLSYTLSYLRGNVPGCDQGGCDQGGYFDAPELTLNSKGPLSTDNTHDIKLFGARDWILSRNMSIATGAAARATSGAPTNYMGSDILYYNLTNYLLPAGSGNRLPWVYNVDANVGFKYAFDRDRSISVGVDIFNLLNLQEVTGVDQQYVQGNTFAVGKQNGTLRDVHVYTNGATRQVNTTDLNPNFGNATGYQSPRMFRFNVRGTF